MTAYATPTQATDQWPGAAKPTGADLTRLTGLLDVGAEQINRAADRDWYAHGSEEYPETWYPDADGSRILHVHGGIVSLESVELRYDESLAYEEVAEGGYYLRGTDPESDAPDVVGLPYFHVVLSGASVHHRWPKGIRSVRLTGVRGHATPPPDLVQANIERARQLFSSDASYSGAAVATDAMGNPITTLPALPASFWAFLKAENSRFLACHL